MFDFVRNHTRLVLGAMLLLIFPSFIFFGIQGYTRFTDSGNVTVAKVDGHAIARSEWEQAVQRQLDRMRRQAPNVDVKLLETPQMKRDVLDALVRERVLQAAAGDLHLAPDAARLERLFKTDPQFAMLRNPDGSINRDLLTAQGMSVQGFEQSLRQDLAAQQVVASIAQTAFAPAAVVNASVDALLQRRAVQLQRFEPAQYAAQVQPGDADIASYYKAHEADFRAPEQASIEYVVLDLDALTRGVTIPEDDLRRYYDENASRWTQAEQRRASHVLVQFGSDRKAAKARAEELLAQLRKAPNTFADVARKNSQDPSAEQGGDLGWNGRGELAAKPLEDAVFAMKPGEISNVVETDFGYHIVTLTGVRGGDRKPFDAVRPEIEAEARRALAQKKYAEAAEQFTNTVYEQSDSLQPVVDKLRLDKRSAQNVQRTPAADATGALGSTRLLNAIFSNDVLRNKRNTDAVEIGPNQLAAARIVQYVPARTLPLADVQPRVRERVVAAQAASVARQEGAKRLAELLKTPSESLPTALTLSRAQSQGQQRALVDAVLRADASKLPAIVGVDLGEQGYVVAKVVQVLPRDPVPGGDAPLLQQYGQAWGAAEALAYVEALKRRYKVEVKETAVAAAAASSPTP